MNKHLAIVVSAFALMSLGTGQAIGQPYPNRPIRLTTVEVGGALDIVIRTIAQGISGPLGKQVVVENKPSALRPEDAFAKAEPNGYSLLYYANTLWLGPFLRANIPYDPLKDFAPISLTVRGPNVVVVTASLPVKSIAELVKLAKAKPGQLNVAVTGVGTSPSMAAVLFESVTGTQMTEIKYKGTGPAFPDVVAGRVEVMFPTILSSLNFAKQGKIRVLAVTSEQRSSLAPDIPTVASLGYPGYESVAIHALLAPAKTPAEIVNRLNQEVVRYLSQADAKETFSKMGFDIVASSPEQLGVVMKAEMDRMGKVLRDAGIHPE